jgi:hypothetical protein
MDGNQTAVAGAADVLGKIIKEYDPLRRKPDRFHDVIIGLGIRFPKPDRGGQEHFPEMTEHIGIPYREKFDMGAVGVRKGIEGQAAGRARQKLIDAGYHARENGIPAFEELRVGDLDAQASAQARKKSRIADLALFMPSIQFIARKPLNEMRRFASGVTGPTAKRSVEIDVEDNASEIEQQRIGDAGREQGWDHGGGLPKSAKIGDWPDMLGLFALDRPQYRYGSMSKSGKALRT